VSRFDAVLTRVENVLAAGALAAAAIIAIAAVISRYVFDYFIFWSEESIIWLVIFSTFIGAVITLRHNEHVNVDIIAVFLGERGKRIMALLGIVMFLVYLGAIGFFAWVMIFEPRYSNTVTPALKLPLWVVSLALPIGSTLMFLRSLEILFRLARGRNPFPEAAASLVAAEGGSEADLQAELARAEADAARTEAEHEGEVAQREDEAERAERTGTWGRPDVPGSPQDSAGTAPPGATPLGPDDTRNTDRSRGADPKEDGR
jgi:C4-dicarboxylate transporter DctQ subunit